MFPVCDDQWILRFLARVEDTCADASASSITRWSGQRRRVLCVVTAGAYLHMAHFMGRFFQCSSGPPSQINMLYSNESIYKLTGLLEDIDKCA